MSRWLFHAALFHVIGGCVDTTFTGLRPEGARVRVSSDSQVSNCQYIGDFPAGEGPRLTLPGSWGSDRVRNLAGAKGATDVVFDAEARGNPVGKGYRCPQTIAQ